MPSGMTINGCMLLESHGKRWVNFPSREGLKEGEKTYYPIIEIPDRDDRERFMGAVVPIAVAAFRL
jgi:hypothetical protein